MWRRRLLDLAVLIPDSQCGFRKYREITDMFLTAKQLKEKCQNKMWTSTCPFSTSPKHPSQPVVTGFNFFNLKWLQAKSKVQKDVLDKLLFADDMAENAKTGTKCKELWIEFLKHLTTMASQSAQKD